MKSWMKKSYLSIAAILSYSLLHSQGNETDSLLVVLKDAKEDTILIDTYNRISVIY